MPIDFGSPAFSRRSVLRGLGAAASLVLLHPFSARAAANQAHLRLMETTDIHVTSSPTTTTPTRRTTRWAWRAPAAIIDQIRAEATNSMLIDNGDLIQGNPMGDYVAYRARHQGRRRPSRHRGDEHARLRGLDARQPRVQLRPRFPGQVAGRRQLPVRLRQPHQGVELAADPTKDDLFFRRSRSSRRRSPTATAPADDQDRLHRLRAAADHDLGHRPTSTARSQTRDIVKTAKA